MTRRLAALLAWIASWFRPPVDETPEERADREEQERSW
jgi:hypothetical protein